MSLKLPRGDVVNVDGLPAEELALQDRATQLCANFRRVVDAHAHVGARAISFARQFLHVEAFEPQDECYRCFVENVASPRVTLRHVGIHAKSGMGYAPLVSGKDSASTSIHVAKLKNTVRIPIAAIDDFGWDDVDLIFISRSTDWLEVIAGALETIRRSFPIICVLPKERGQSGTQIIRKLAPLLAIGYKVEEIDDDGLILRAPHNEVATPPVRPKAVLIPGGVLPDDHLVLEATEYQPSPAAPRATQSLIGRTLAPTRSPVLPMTSGPLHIHDLMIKPPFSIEGYRGARLPNGHLIKFDDVETCELSALADQIRVTLSAAGGTIDIPPALAVVATRLRVEVERADGSMAPVLNQRIDQIALIDAAGFRWPLDCVGARSAGVIIELLRDDIVIASIRSEIDFALHHIDRRNLICYLNRGGGGIPAIQALADSLGCKTYYAEDGYRPGVAIVWGVLRGSREIIREAVARDTIFYYIDHAYFSRGHGRSYRITRDAFEAGPVRLCPTDRLEALDIEVSPWSKGGEAIIVCPPTAYFMDAHDCHGWLDDTLRTLRKHSKRPIIIREKKGDTPLQPLAEALADAHALVTHSSNVAIEAAVLGTPVFVSPTSAAAPVGLTDLARIESPVRPPREAWLAHLAYSQFSFEEMQSGEVWTLLQDFERFPFA